MSKDKRKVKKKKVFKWILVGFLVLLFLFLIFWVWYVRLDYSDTVDEVTWGVTFSHKYAGQDLGIDWTDAYWQMITDLGVKDVRLVAHWDMIEERDNEYNFADLEWMMDVAEENDVNILFALGRRTPRWPECHDPVWIKNLSKEEQDAKLLEMMEKTVKHFRRYDNIVAWQIENEPFLQVFGECPPPDEDLLRKEVDLVRSFDDRPIMITDSGELSNWNKAASLGDIFGTTMYKVVWVPFVGIWRYPWPPAFYYYKTESIKEKYDLDKVIVSELQAEPWRKEGMYFSDLTKGELRDLFSLYDMRKNIEYVKKAGYDEVYLWGVEWWFWLKQVKGDDSFWEEGKKIWQGEY